MTLWKSELKCLLQLAVPVIVSNLLTLLLSMVDLLFVGQKLGAESLAAAVRPFWLHIGWFHLNHQALGNTWFNFYFFMLSGATTMFDTYCSQAFGARQYKHVGLWTQRGTVLMFLFSIPAIFLWGATEPILRYVFREEPELSKEAASFVVWLIPGLIPFVLFMCMQRFLIAQNIAMPTVYVGIFANLFNVVANMYYIDWFGFPGASMATSTTRFVQCFLLAGYIVWRKPHKRFDTWLPWDWKLILGLKTLRQGVAAQTGGDDGADDKQLLGGHTHAEGGFDTLVSRPRSGSDGSGDATEASDIDPVPPAAVGSTTGSTNVRIEDVRDSSRPLWCMFKLAVAGGMMTAFEAWTFEITTMYVLAQCHDMIDLVDTVWLRLVYHRLAGQLSHSDLSAHVIVLSITGFAFLSLPLGVSIAASIRVGQTLGEGRPDIARVSAQLSVVLGAGFMGASGLAMLLAGDRMGAIFTSNEEVLATVAVIAPVAALFQVVDGIQGCAQGVLRGMGRQIWNLKVNVIGFWVIGTPVGAALTFWVGIGITGLWWGLALGLFVVMIIIAVVLVKVDWDAEAAKAQARIVGDVGEHQKTGEGGEGGWETGGESEEGWEGGIDVLDEDGGVEMV